MKYLVFISIFLFVIISSCNKCDPSNSIGGEVIEGAVIKVINGPSEPMLIRSENDITQDISVRFDGELSYQDVDFSKYSVMCLPTTASCSSGYDRVVQLDAGSQTVRYTVTITECDTCEGQTRIHNWVLIPVVPANIDPVFEVK